MTNNIHFRTNRDVFKYIYNEVEKTTKSLKVAVAWFTDPELLKLILTKRDIDKINVTVILYNDEINKELRDLSLLQDDLCFFKITKFKAIMHHKFCIIDDIKVVTGLYNWTIKARRHNRENVIGISDKSLATAFDAEFKNLLLNCDPQSQVRNFVKRTNTENIEDLQLLELETRYNNEMLRRIKESEDLDIGIDTALAYKMIGNNTPVIAATQLATAERGEYFQSGLLKLYHAHRLDLSFEESIVRNEFQELFSKETKDIARLKLQKLNYFSDPYYTHLLHNYQ